MTTDTTTARQRAGNALFLDGQGWGFGGSVDVDAIDPWNVPGRYGWVGGTGTTDVLRDFWAYAATGPAGASRP